VIRSVALLALLAPPALAQDLTVVPEVIEQRLATGLSEGCIGLAAQLCVTEAGPGSEGLCRGAETAYWQRRMEAAETALRAREPEVQARARRYQWPDPVPSVEAMAARFAAYREATCDWRAASWDGIHAGYEAQDCLMRLTARQALVLEGMQDE
jgi:Protein of unknown function (DUF1311).